MKRLIDVVGLVDIVYSPVADIKKFPENVDVTLIEGAVCNSDHIKEAKEIRERSKVVISFGDCRSDPKCSQHAKSAGRQEHHFGSILGRSRCGASRWRDLDIMPVLLDKVLPLTSKSSLLTSICRGALLIRKGSGRQSPCC